MTIKVNSGALEHLAKFGPNLQTIRVQKGLSREAFAERIDVSSRIIYDYENGLKYPTLSRATLIADVLGVTLDSLLR
jgi:transcriptional regulator with XRE-family HTH domain